MRVNLPRWTLLLLAAVTWTEMVSADDELKECKLNQLCEELDFAGMFQDLRVLYMWSFNQGIMEGMGKFYTNDAYMSNDFMGYFIGKTKITNQLMEEKVKDTDYIYIDLTEAYALNCTMGYSWEEMRSANAQSDYKLARVMIMWKCVCDDIEQCTKTEKAPECWKIHRELVAVYHSYDSNDPTGNT